MDCFLFLFLFAWRRVQVLDFILYFVRFRFRILDIRFSKVYSITCSFIIIIRIHLENRTDAKIGIFPIPIVYWSGFGIFKQNRENPDTTKTVGQSPYVAIFFCSYKKMFSKIRINLLAICQDSCRVVPNFYVRVLGCWKSSYGAN